MAPIPPMRRDEAIRALAASAVFVALGGVILRTGFGDPVAMPIVAWVSLLFGLIGIIGVSLRLSGLWRPELHQPSPRAKAQKSPRAGSAVAPVHFSGELPVLAPARKGVVKRIVTLLAAQGVFAPEVPEPDTLYAGLADWDGPITQSAVLMALVEANYWHPDIDPDRYIANLVLHDSHVEQFEDSLRAQIDDLVRLARGALDVTDVSITLALGSAPHCTIRMTVNGSPLALDYVPASKYLSTHIHVALARALKAGSSGKRLAWLWDDQGPWMACLNDGAIDRLNAGPGADKGGYGGWEWIDMADPVAAGEGMEQ